MINLGADVFEEDSVIGSVEEDSVIGSNNSPPPSIMQGFEMSEPITVGVQSDVEKLAGEGVRVYTTPKTCR